MDKQASLEEAQEAFKELQSNPHPHSSQVEYIEKNLKDAGFSPGAETKNILNNIRTNTNTREAQSMFQQLQEAMQQGKTIPYVTGFKGAPHRVDLIERLLRKADADASVLDPGGESTAEEMKQQLSDLRTYFNLREARERFENFKNGSPFYANGIKGIEYLLDDANIDPHELYAEGNQTDEQVEDELDALDETLRIREVRSIFDELRNATFPQREQLYRLQKRLDDGNLKADVLDPGGQKNSARMNAEILKIGQGINTRVARELFRRVDSGKSSDVNKDVAQIQHLLEEFELDASALDPEGRKTAGAMQVALNAAVYKAEHPETGKIGITFASFGACSDDNASVLPPCNIAHATPRETIQKQ